MALLLFLAVPALAFAGGNRESDTATPDAAEQPADAQDQGQRIEVSDAVARVNGELVSREEFDNVVASNISRYEYQSGQTFNDAQRPGLEQQVLDGLITRTILEQETDRLGITVSDERFNETLGQFKEQFPNDSAYQMALEEQGFTEAEFEQELRRQMVIEELIRSQVYDQIEVTDEDIRGFYDDNPQYFEQPEQVAARHIILTTQDVDDAGREELRAQLEDIRQQIVDGADFAEMAREYSQGPSAENGGDLGTFGRGQMVPEFEQVAFSLDVGEVSDIVETQFGYHIVQVTERIPAQTQSFEDSRDRIQQFLTEEARNRGAQEYVRGLRDTAEVEQLIEIDAPAAPAQAPQGPEVAPAN
tara:strand:- start:1538 stop:2617 length:1080 start_codon:yes stop_codon:yes gene_type:complete